MKKLLKYIFTIILVAITFIGGTDESDSTVSQSPSCEMISETTLCFYDSSTSDFNLYLPQQVIHANIFRSPNTARRTNQTHKNHSKFSIIGKTTHTDTGTSIYKESVITYASFINSDHQLISLGKLLI